MNMYDAITETIRTILTERNDPVPDLEPGTSIANSGLDSLDVAALVVRLEQRLVIDPFQDGALARFPRTLGELANLYEQHNQRG